MTKEERTVGAGRWDDPLSVDAGAIGFFRVMYNDATLQVDTKAFGTLVDGDRIALLDDQWALVQSGSQKLSSYLAMASSMGSDLDERAWSQIAVVLGKIEYDERDARGHDAFTAYARSIMKPVADRLGWDAKPDETSGLQMLRRTALRDLGDWGDSEVVSIVRKRFAAFVKDRSTIPPDDQQTILHIVARNGDGAALAVTMQLATCRIVLGARRLRRFELPPPYRERTPNRDPHGCGINAAPPCASSPNTLCETFQLHGYGLEQLHELAKSARDETELRRFYGAPMLPRDPKLAELAAQIVLSDEIPAQAAAFRLRLIGALADYHPALAWKTFTGHTDTLLKPLGFLAPIILTQYVPQMFWNGVPLDQIETWIKALAPADLASNLARGMEAARFQVSLKKALVPAADGYLQTLSGNIPASVVE